ncbi:hypothetical protein AU198_10465 [Mycobacterium sp. GA-1199]|nr:hypothetical protein AU198_10465 [Mycobacterium sp. GA-1199]
MDYPTDARLPPPLSTPPPPGYPPYPASVNPYSGYHPPVGYGYDPYRPMKPPGTNGMAIGALVSSLVGVFCCGVTCIVGVILGVMAMRETKRTGQDGYGIALAGTIIGGLAVAGFLIYILLYMSLLASGRQWI